MIKFVTALIMNTEGKVLAVSRRGKPEDLGLPGGKINPGETPEQAIIREAQEETGITLTKFEFVFDRQDPLGQEEECRCFRVTEYTGEPQSIEPDISVSWVCPERFLEPNCTFRSYNSDLFRHLGMVYLYKKPSTFHKKLSSEQTAKALGAELLPDDHPLAIKMRTMMAATNQRRRK